MERLPILLTDKAGTKSSMGFLEIQNFSPEERRKRAFKFGGRVFLIGVACIVLPLVHFVLPPLLFIISPFVARYYFRQERAILGGGGKCPNCGADFPVAKRPPKFPFDDVCTACRQAVVVNAAS
jgi:hypothetical protein